MSCNWWRPIASHSVLGLFTAMSFLLPIAMAPTALAAERNASATARPGTPWKVGVIHLSQQAEAPVVIGLRQGLKELGYVEGRDVVLEIRAGRGRYENALEAAHELVRKTGVHMLVSAGTVATRAAKEAAGGKLPVVFTQVGDPVAAKFVASISRPGGNMTGFSHLLVDTTGKRLELLKEMVPRLRTVLVIYDPGNPTSSHSVKAARDPARKLGIMLRERQIGSRQQALEALEEIDRKSVDAILMVPDSLVVNAGEQIIAKSQELSLPVMFHESTWVNRGGLASYGASFSDLGRQAARYVDKIHKGKNPALLPVEQPSRFELVLNLTVAKSLGLNIPESVLVRADRVIE